MLENFAKPFFQLEKRQKILQNHFFGWKNTGKFCKTIFSVGKTPENFAKPFFQLEKHRKILQLAETVYAFLFPCEFTLLQLTSIL